MYFSDAIKLTVEKLDFPHVFILEFVEVLF